MTGFYYWEQGNSELANRGVTAVFAIRRHKTFIVFNTLSSNRKPVIAILRQLSKFLRQRFSLSAVTTQSNKLLTALQDSRWGG